VPRSSVLRSRPKGSPAVIFLDDRPWAAFYQLSPQLQRAGIRTVRVTTRQVSRSWVTSRLLFDQFVSLPSADPAGQLRRLLSEENVYDVQFVETLSQLMGSGVDVLRDDVAQGVRQRLSIMDKWNASARFRENGVPTPDVIAVHDATPEQIVQEFGLPVVLKDRIGCGGSSVAICDDVAALRVAYDEFLARDSECYFERFLDGEKLNYSAAYSDDGLEQELAYRVTRWVPPVGTAIEVETIDDPGLIEVGRRAVEVSGCVGLMNMDVIRDAEGAYWLIDFNARSFGGSSNFLLAGLDLSQGYLRSLHCRSAVPDAPRPEIGRVVEIFPTCMTDAIRTGNYAIVARSFVPSVWPYLRRLGWRYALVEVLKTFDATRKIRSDRAHDSRRR